MANQRHDCLHARLFRDVFVMDWMIFQNLKNLEYNPKKR